MKKALLIMALLLASPSMAADKAGAQAAIDAAEALRKQAAALEAEWRFTGKHIKGAQEALKNGDYDKAEELAERAKWESETALKQVETGKQVWRIAVPK